MQSFILFIREFFIEQFPKSFGGGRGVRSQDFKSSFSKPLKIQCRMPSDKSKSDFIADSQFVACVNDPQADRIIVGLNQF